MRWIRLLSAFIAARSRPKLRISDESIISFRVWPLDIDVSIMNHASIMTVMEMGRIDYMVRSGFFALAKRKKWYFPSAGISVQFIRPLKLFQKAYVHTRVFHVDANWIYLEQKVVRNNKVMAMCVVKSKVKKGRETIDTNEILKELQLSSFPAEASEMIEYYTKETSLMYDRTNINYS